MEGHRRYLEHGQVRAIRGGRPRPAFDPERYKTPRREQLDTAAQAWHHWSQRSNGGVACGRLQEFWFGVSHEKFARD